MGSNSSSTITIRQGRAAAWCCTFAFLLITLLVVMCACAKFALAETMLSVEGDAACDTQLNVGVSEFHKAKRGSANALSNGQNIGYRYITGASDNAVLIATSDEIIVYVPSRICSELSLDMTASSTQQAVFELLRALDVQNSEGGASLAGVDVPIHFTSERTFTTDWATYYFAQESEGRSYAGVVLHFSTTSRTLFCDYGSMVAADSLDIAVSRSWSEELHLFFSRVDWSPLFVSARTTLVATVIVLFTGILAAWLSLRVGARASNILDWIFTIPMILPPSVCGLLLVYFFGKQTPSGRWLISMGINLPFTWAAAVIAATVVSFPFMYRAARGAFENLDASLFDVARTLGWGEWRILTRLMVPLSAPSLVAGAILSFTRALGEFGATTFFAGSFAGRTQTIPLALYDDWMAGDEMSAWLWAAITLLFSLLAMFILNRVAEKEIHPSERQHS